MKIFSWVHRQFLRKDAYKKDDNINNDKVALLENEGFAGACNGWNDGLLAIGTFGVDLYQDFKHKEDTFMSNKVIFVDVNGDDHDHDHDHDHDEEMESPLVPKASKHGVDHVEKHSLSPCVEVAKNKNHQEDDVVVKDLTKGKKGGERITLADLLRVDSEDNLLKNDELADDPKINVGNNNANKIGNTSTGSIKSFLVSKAKKKPGKDDSAQPIKKTKQFMRKMLRKKIHPTIGIQKMDVGHAHATS
ncbi:hypothetical protein HanXRQr2_Chr16g0767041 [Helianthus annuus]|uniref:Protein TILLER ANGLE CONTROL 1 n=1 Tax=Helianthus annuus TaxID=4232 RepID=A0A251S2B2_HELAN|nr:uncharacterized protein LOC110916008 [Helianthus annuus]KAF5761605.1 hypothetical protein HanXRQr2_Chr16g0767041 [Helianthus annuus]KAJ0461790.1 hypothetical protein HanHA89_Chr16g0676321 [Helianthus annuus]KAJ0642176.1 hypothetical protein HanLR1_Chr16g0635431 [Helianthus annuus]KAJ0646066.1 hypothetical protein HanOQP8_Chr16g0631061 [Helianthus annuus]KAJ0822706.1 hypothetical protein HanPSC8_Chr16g0735241 [Helianthus annuus]